MPAPAAPPSTWKGLHRAAAFQGAATAVLLLVGAYQGVMAIASAPAQQRLRPTLNLSSFLAGRTTAAVNYVMAHQLPADPLLRASGGVFRYALFGSGGPQVRIGCDETMFLTEELRPWPNADVAMAERAEGVRRVQAALAARNIALAVAVVPDKARVAADKLCGVPHSAQAAARYDAFLAALRARGIEPIALLPALSAQQRQPGGAFYRTDTHWNQAGARAAAQAIAQAVQNRDLTRGEEFRTTAAAEETDGPGDLLRITSLDHVPNAVRPDPDRERKETTAAPEGGDSGGGSLLDETPSPEVALIGSSYSVNANFHGALQEALRSTVFNGATAGGGFAGAAATYFSGETYRESPPRLIIWEIPERVVPQPLTEAERAFIARW
ncbi:alginate O-acetyltransferase AlgX-related protein [Muricoccus radiodurans]|uniref:alginate O-acetyltransferase AlgX-related protein n=1 Tax=Muricoccus radiodurans TaxID=2231721 RepID=UPI003CF46809